ncbi:MAG: asparaginase [Ruminococcus sp.]|nr:asparaginase [Ruminococcus sp.]
MNILLIATGGTIGSAFDGVSINVRADVQCAVAEEYAALHDGVRFDIKKPLNILSESLSAADLNTLAGVLLQTDYNAYDGVILTVGSDNLAHLSAFVSLLLHDCEKPVALVATNLILSDPAANGRENFSCAVELIREGRAGVFVPYRNDDGVMYVHSAADIRQADLSENFYSFQGAYAVYNGAFRELRPYVMQTIPAVFDGEHLPCISNNVLLIHPYPLQDYSRLSTDGVRAVLHTLYHSATLDSGAAAPFLASMDEVPLFLASFRSGRKRYQTSVEAIADGAIPLEDISPECAYMKLLLACAQTRLPIRAFMEG